MAKAKEREHALLSASSAARWMKCPPSARLEDGIVDEQSTYAAEGTLAHQMCELKLMAGELKPGTYTRRMNKLKKHELFDPEMAGYTDEYADYVESICNNLPEKPYMTVEKKVDYSVYAPEGFGTADCIIIHKDVMHIIDFKYGKGVPVSAEGNPQMGLYALGALAAYGFIFPIEKVHFHIVQPRLHNFSTWDTSRKELECWGEKIVKPKAELAFKGEGEFRSGDHCRFCRVANCRQRACDNLKLLEEYQGKLPPVLSDKEVGEALEKAEQLVAWHKKLRSYAQGTLLDGKQIPGWKIVEGRSVRIISDYEKAVDALQAAGYNRELFYQTTGLTLTEMEKVVGKKEMSEICGEFIEKPPGKPAIASESDKRPEYNPRTTAVEDFK